jgi:hypothetical protein
MDSLSQIGPWIFLAIGFGIALRPILDNKYRGAMSRTFRDFWRNYQLRRAEIYQSARHRVIAKRIAKRQRRL